MAQGNEKEANKASNVQPHDVNVEDYECATSDGLATVRLGVNVERRERKVGLEVIATGSVIWVLRLLCRISLSFIESAVPTTKHAP